MSQPIRGQGGYLVFLFSPKNASLVEDVVKFCWILFSGFRGKVENVSANHRPGRPFCFSDPPEKHKLGRGHWDLASYQVSLNSFHSFRGEVENVSVNQRPGRPFCFFPICLKNTNVVEGIESLLPVKFRLIPFSCFRGEVENVSANQRPERPFCFSDRPKKHKLVEGVEILLPIKFHWIRFSGFRGEVENVSANQRQGRPSCFSDRPEKHKLGRGRLDLDFCQVSLNSIQRFQRRSRKISQPIRGQAAILFFRLARNTQTW